MYPVGQAVYNYADVRIGLWNSRSAVGRFFWYTSKYIVTKTVSINLNFKQNAFVWRNKWKLRCRRNCLHVNFLYAGFLIIRETSLSLCHNCNNSIKENNLLRDFQGQFCCQAQQKENFQDPVVKPETKVYEQTLAKQKPGNIKRNAAMW